MLRLIAATLACVCAAGCQRPTPADCERLLDHYTELVARERQAASHEGDLERLQAAARTRAEAVGELNDCGRTVSRRQLGCALEAPSVDAFERCLM